MEAMQSSGINCAVYLYNPNIHPVREYEIRERENARFAEKYGIEFIDADYDMDNWLERVKGLKNSPERNERCTKCFACILSARPFMPMSMVSIRSLACWVFRAGRT